MQAYLIDPFARTVSTVEHAGDLQSVYSLIGCSCIDAIRLRDAGRDAIYCDDEGLLLDLSSQAFAIIWQGHGATPGFLAGKGLLVGATTGGDDCTPALTLEQAQARVIWVSNSDGADIARRLLGMTGTIYPLE